MKATKRYMLCSVILLRTLIGWYREKEFLRRNGKLKLLSNGEGDQDAAIAYMGFRMIMNFVYLKILKKIDVSLGHKQYM